MNTILKLIKNETRTSTTVYIPHLIALGRILWHGPKKYKTSAKVLINDIKMKILRGKPEITFRARMARGYSIISTLKSFSHSLIQNKNYTDITVIAFRNDV